MRILRIDTGKALGRLPRPGLPARADAKNSRQPGPNGTPGGAIDRLDQRRAWGGSVATAGRREFPVPVVVGSGLFASTIV